MGGALLSVSKFYVGTSDKYYRCYKVWAVKTSLMISTIEMIISLTVLGSFVEIESLFCPLGDWHCQYLHMHHIIPTSLWQP